MKGMGREYKIFITKNFRKNFLSPLLQLSSFCNMISYKYEKSRIRMRPFHKTDRMDNRMSEIYVECLIKKKSSPVKNFFRALTIMLAVAFIFLGLIFSPALIIGLLMAVVAYFVYMNAELEYEYLYLDKELTVDKVMAKTRRKRVAQYDLNRMEIFAPMNSYHLDNFKNRKVKDVDYSSGEARQPEVRYVMYYDSGEKVVLEPNEEMIKAIKNIAPRKVFTD